MVRVAIATCALAGFWASTSSSAWAQPIPGEERFQGLFPQNQTTMAAGVGFGQIGEDWFLSITPRLDLSFGRIGLGLQVPLNLRLIDLDPQQTDDIGDVIRKQDWDEPTEFLRAIQYVRWGFKREMIYFRAGQLAAEIGHGTIVARYMNNTDVDSYRLGLQFDVNTPYGGVETLIADVGMFGSDYSGSRLAGARGYVKPVAFWDADSFLNIFQVGYTMVVDAGAPLQLASESAGNSNNRMVVDDDGNFLVDRGTDAVVMGWDVEAELLNNMFLDLIPYVDMNYLMNGDAGFHAGVKAAVKIPFILELTVPMKAEYRFMGPRYMPTYFNTLYELERYNFPGGTRPGRDADTNGQGGVVGPGRPKAFAALNQPGGGGRNGFFADAALNIAGYLQVGALYENYDGSPGGNLAIYVNVPAFDTFQLKAYYARANITDPGDIFNFDERSIAVAQARYELFSFLFLVARWTRQWEVDPTDGKIIAADSWKIGAEVGYTF